jgi:uncharacterized membrane protein
MPNTAINTGRILILIGVIGYIVSMINAKTSLTALIPAMFGIAMLILGHLARMKESLRKHLMHAAVLVSLIGFLAVAARLVMKFDQIAFTPAYISQIATAVVFLAFVIYAVKSFIDARKNASTD